MAGQLDLTPKFEDLSKSVDKLTKELAELAIAVKDVDKELKQTADTQEKISSSTKKTSDNAQKLEEIEKERIKLTKQLNKANSTAIDKNEELRLQLQQQKKANKEAAKEKLGLIGAYEKESKKLTELRKKYKDLAVQNKENTKEGKELLKNITELDSKLKDVDESVGQSQRNVGNYTSALDGLKAGFQGALQQAKAFIANPIGATIAAITGLILLFRKAVNRSEEATEAFNKVGAFFTGVLNGVAEALTPVVEIIGNFLVKALKSPKDAVKDLGEAIKQNLINRFKALGQIGKALIKVFSKDWKQGLNDLGDATIQLTTGVTNASDKIKKFGETVKEVQEATIATANAEREYAKTQIELEKTQLRLQNEAEKLRQIRDDEAIQIEERIRANTELGRVLDEQTAIEVRLAQENLNRAIMQQKANGETIESIEKIGEAQIKLLEIEERITGQRSEQLVNTNSLLKEQADLRLAQEEELIALADSVTESEEDITDSIYEQIQLRADAEREAREQKIEDEKQANELIRNERINLANDLFNFTSTLRDRELANLQENVKKGLITEEQAAKKEAEIKRKQAIADKAQGIFNGIINTAQAITKINATIPPPFNIPLVALVAAQGAIQVATIAAQPIPQFAKGVTDFEGGVAEVGERGRELVKLPSGDAFIAEHGIYNLPKGADVIPNFETEKIIRGGMEVSKLNELISENRSLRRAILNRPENIVNLDDGGLRYSYRRNNVTQKWIDKNIRQ